MKNKENNAVLNNIEQAFLRQQELGPQEFAFRVQCLFDIEKIETQLCAHIDQENVRPLLELLNNLHRRLHKWIWGTGNTND